MSLKYAVIGTGAIGGYYGGKLAKSGLDVHFLFRSDYEFITKNGLKIDSIAGNFELPSPNAYNNTDEMPACDVVLVCLKTTQNHYLKELLPPLLHKNTIAIMIQNGLGVEADLQKEFTDLHIVGGLAFICATKTSLGHISHLDYGKLILGSYSCPDNSGVLRQVCEDFNRSGIESEIQNLQTARWKKLVWNIPFNGMTVIMNSTTDTLITQPEMKKLLLQVMKEVIEAANISDLKGDKIPDKYADETMIMTEHMTPYSPSMKVDFDTKREMEIHYLYSKPIEYASQCGYDMTRVSVMEKQLQFIQSLYINNK